MTFRKKYKSHFIFLMALSAVLVFSNAYAKVEWDIIKDISLEDKPLDVAVSKDGATAFILCSKNILLYSVQKNRVSDTIPVSGNYSQIALSPDGEKLFLTDTSKKKMSIVQISHVYNINIGQSPVIGSADAKVNIFAFIDFQ